jgi:hypothetical protein
MSADRAQGRRGGGTPPPRRHTPSSLALCRLRHRSGRRNVVVERVVEKSTTTIVYPTLI